MHDTEFICGPHSGHHKHPANRRRGGRGFPPPGFGPGGPRGRRGRGQRGRGDVRAAALLLLDEQPHHGYQLIQEIAERSNQVWTPSPGSIYPSLQQLEDEGLIEFDRVEGRKTASLTETGKAYVEEHREELGSPWDTVNQDGGSGAMELKNALRDQLHAARQVFAVGTPAQHAKAVEVLTDSRKALYRILADDEPEQ
ncbi:hypothetical protein BH09ACT10_BH09ACT10_17650 [soil metagenome]